MDNHLKQQQQQQQQQQQHEKQLTTIAATTASINSNRMGARWWQCHVPEDSFDMSWYLSIRGGEYVHLYLWILKDLSWTQDWLDRQLAS